MTQTQHAAPQTGAVYSLVGTLIEACSCGVNCPCWIGEDPDLGECFAIVAYGLDQGRIRGVDVSGLNLVLIAHIPGNVLAGNWEIVALVDERATPEQRDLLLGAFTGKLGGPLADLAQLIGSVKGVEFVPISHHVEGGTGTPADPGDGGGRDGPVPGPGREHHHPAELGLLHGAGLLRLGGQGQREPGQPAPVRHDLGVRGAETRSSPSGRWSTRRDRQRLRRGAAAPGAGHPASGCRGDRGGLGPGPCGPGHRPRRLLGHDELIHSGLPLWAALACTCSPGR